MQTCMQALAASTWEPSRLGAKRLCAYWDAHHGAVCNMGQAREPLAIAVAAPLLIQLQFTPVFLQQKRLKA